MRTITRLAALAGILLSAAPVGADTAVPGSRLSIVLGDREPAGADHVSDLALAALQTAVDGAPGDRTARFALVRALMRAHKLDAALTAAKAWRAVDAYNLVVVRLIGDIQSELGQRDLARRAYSAVVELLPKDASAHRALASVLKQAGDLQGAYDRLIVAAAMTKDDRRLAFELADVANRLGKADEARERFAAIVADPTTPEAVRYPSAQRLAQIDHAAARAARAAGEADRAKELEAGLAALKLAGGTENDIKVYLTWDTDRSDVDLWVTSPAGEKVFYSHKNGKDGEALYDDVTTGYGPESYTAPHAQAGDYLVQVNYYGAGRSNFSEARGEVVVILDEGKATESRHVLPYRLYDTGQTVTVARVHVDRHAVALGGSK
ncbi:MAG: DUF2135 domain-containing protein [Deltaproteobacteria bacterium]|nr:DUF2135 domain-containing protein [Deltaproteobacteria bacterium]